MTGPAIETRWLITGHLASKTAVRALTGYTVTETGADGNPHEVMLFVRNSGGRPMLPGSSLKGVLRNWLARRVTGPQEQSLRKIFGTPPAGVANSHKISHGGAAEFHDAAATASDAIRNWTGTAIDRDTRSAAKKLLANRQEAQEGTVFDVTITASGLELADVELLLAGLDGFGADDPVAIGGSTGGGLGRMAWTLAKVQKLDQAVVKAWLAQRGGQVFYHWARQSGAGIIAVPAPASLVNNSVSLTATLTLDFNAPLIVATKIAKTAATPERLVHVTRAGGQHYLPGSSIIGALRSQAEKILRTIKADAVPERGAETGDLQLIEQIFGSARISRALRIDEMELAAPAKTYIKERLAVDRLTGTVAGDKKFVEEYLEAPVFSGTVHLDLARTPLDPALAGKTSDNTVPGTPGLDAAALGLLLLLWRDLQEGDVHFGRGAAAGYGACTASLAPARLSTNAMAALNAIAPECAKALGDWAAGKPVTATMREALANEAVTALLVRLAPDPAKLEGEQP